MVKTWAEKELRNLKRLQVAGIPSPEPYLLKSHVLIMEFLGSQGWCAPRLKDANLTYEELISCYRSLAIDMRRLFQDCNLVHGDLSEYNLLWHENRIRIIDVSQSVEQSHPFASEFLRKDVSNVTDFFMKKGLEIGGGGGGGNLLSKFDLFQFIIEKEPVNPLANRSFNSPEEMISLPEYGEYLRKLEDKLDELLASGRGGSWQEERGEEGEGVDREVEEAVFLQSFIPTRLSEISNPYKEMELLQKKGAREKVYQSALLNMISAKEEGEEEEDEKEDSEEEDDEEELKALIAKLTTPGSSTKPVVSATVADKEASAEGEKIEGGEEVEEAEDSKSDDDDDEDEDDEEDDEEGEGEDGKYRRKLPTRDNPEERQKEKAARKEARKAMKEAKATKRMNKIPKHVKKRAMKAGKK